MGSFARDFNDELTHSKVISGLFSATLVTVILMGFGLVAWQMLLVDCPLCRAVLCDVLSGQCLTLWTTLIALYVGLFSVTPHVS